MGNLVPDDDFPLDDFDDEVDFSEAARLAEESSIPPEPGATGKKHKWRDVEEYREWKRLRDLLGDDDPAELDF